ncbi:hypothetical protein MRX96_048816 [Rhipicephalus microplus]
MVDAPASAIYAGVGSELARLLFQHFFAAQQRWKSTMLEKLHERMRCVYTADVTTILDRATRDDVVVATAATSTLWHAFLSAALPTASNISSPATDLDSQLPKLSERQLFSCFCATARVETPLDQCGATFHLGTARRLWRLSRASREHPCTPHTCVLYSVKDSGGKST